MGASCASGRENVLPPVHQFLGHRPGIWTASGRRRARGASLGAAGSAVQRTDRHERTDRSGHRCCRPGRRPQAGLTLLSFRARRPGGSHPRVEPPRSGKSASRPEPKRRRGRSCGSGSGSAAACRTRGRGPTCARGPRDLEDLIPGRYSTDPSRTPLRAGGHRAACCPSRSCPRGRRTRSSCRLSSATEARRCTAPRTPGSRP